MAKAKARTRPAAKRRPPAKRRTAAPSRTQKISQGSRQALSPHKGDIQGVVLILAAAMFALGVWLHDGGRAGRFFELLLRGVFGWGAYAVPLLVALVAVALFRRSAARPDEAVGARVAIGLFAFLLGGLGLLHLAEGAPPASAPPEVLQTSGGLAGAVTAAPMAELLSVWGARAVFVCLLFLGALIATRTSVASVGRAGRPSRSPSTACPASASRPRPATGAGPAARPHRPRTAGRASRPSRPRPATSRPPRWPRHPGRPCPCPPTCPGPERRPSSP